MNRTRSRKQSQRRAHARREDNRRAPVIGMNADAYRGVLRNADLPSDLPSEADAIAAYNEAAEAVEAKPVTRAKCPECGYSQKVTGKGTIGAHALYSGFFGKKRCSGSGAVLVP